MDYKCRLGSLGNSFTASWSSVLGRTVGPSYSWAALTSFFSCPLYFTLSRFSPSFCLCLISTVLLPCASVGENTRA